MTQATLGDFSDGEPPEPDGPRWIHLAEPLLSDDAEISKGSCPWCLAPPQHFRRIDGTVSCDDCGVVIPAESDWYQSGEKIIT